MKHKRRRQSILKPTPYFEKNAKGKSFMLIKNVDIITENKPDEIIYGASILIKGDTIERIIKHGEPLPNDAEIIDGNGMIAMPGFVNTHTHCAMTFLRNYGNDMNLQDWLFKKVFPAEDKLTAEAVYWFSKLAYIELIKSGITTHVDSYFFMESSARAVEEAGIRAVLNRSVSGISDPDGEKLKESSSFFRTYNNSCSGRIKSVLGAHSIYTSDEKYIVKVVEEANKIGSGLVTHLCETQKEIDDCILQHNATPVEYLDRIGYFDVDGMKIAAHCVHMSDNDIDILARKNVSAAINMSSNLKLASGIADVPRLIKSGVNVSLGTDGASSNNNLNMFNEMRLAALVYKGITLDPEIMNAETVLSMATANGAKAILDDKIGVVAEGAKADIVLIDTNSPSIAPTNELAPAVVYSAGAGDVNTVICNGKVLMQNKELLTIDENETVWNVKYFARRILSR